VHSSGNETVTNLSSCISATALHLFHQTNDVMTAQCLEIQRNIAWSFWRQASSAYQKFTKIQQYIYYVNTHTHTQTVQ